MKKILIIAIIYFGSSSYILAENNCKDLPGFKKVGKDSQDYIKCLADKVTKVTKDITGGNKFKLNTDSKFTDWLKKKMNK
jgi:hypothetical protein